MTNIDLHKQLEKVQKALREIRYRFFIGSIPTTTGWEESGTINQVGFDTFEKVLEETGMELDPE